MSLLAIEEILIKFIENKLKLRVNRTKSKVDRPWRIKYLGFALVFQRLFLQSLKVLYKTFGNLLSWCCLFSQKLFRWSTKNF